MLSEKLKGNTKTAHQELEKLLVKNIKSIRSTEDYLVILSYFYRFFAPLEKKIVYQLETALPDIMERRKTTWILDDLDYFQGVLLPRPYLSPILAIDNPFQAIGALYVIEGSTLGGQIICKMIAQKLGISTEHGFRFFSGYGKVTHKRWEDFKDFLNNNDWILEEEKTVIDTANRTFDAFKQSMR